MDAITQDNSISAGQVKLISRLVSDAAERAIGSSLQNKRDAQCVIERGDELVAVVRTTISSTLKELAQGDRFGDEEVHSEQEYNTQYLPRNLSLQCTELIKLFPQLRVGALHQMELKVPEGAEAWFAIPRWEAVAETYTGAVKQILDLLGARLPSFINHRTQLLEEGILHEGTQKVLARERVLTDGDILLIPAQFGLRHRGRSVRRACALMGPGEFPLGAFEVGTMLLLHPERISSSFDLWIDCGGDVCREDRTDPHSHCIPYFYSTRGPLEFGIRGESEARKITGVASGFI